MRGSPGQVMPRAGKELAVQRSRAWRGFDRTGQEPSESWLECEWEIAVPSGSRHQVPGRPSRSKLTTKERETVVEAGPRTPVPVCWWSSQGRCCLQHCVTEDSVVKPPWLRGDHEQMVATTLPLVPRVPAGCDSPGSPPVKANKAPGGIWRRECIQTAQRRRPENSMDSSTPTRGKQTEKPKHVNDKQEELLRPHKEYLQKRQRFSLCSWDKDKDARDRHF